MIKEYQSYKSILLTLSGYIAGESVEVYSFQADIWAPSSIDVFLQYDFFNNTDNKPEFLRDFSLCYWRLSATLYESGSVHFSLSNTKTPDALRAGK